MDKSHGREITRKAISELERLSEVLDEAFEITANISPAELDEGLREMGVDPNRLPSPSLSRILSDESEPNPAYLYVSDESLRDEAAPAEAKRLILEVRFLGQQQRYEEALELAEHAVRLAPDYWRAWNSYGTLLAVLGNLDEADAIFHRVLEDFHDDPKAVAAALHNCAFLKEVRCELNPSRASSREVSRLYEEALGLDGSRANTRACLVINSMLTDQIAKGNELLKDSRLCEGFLDAVVLETAERGARHYAAPMYKVKKALSMELRNLLYGAGPCHAGGAVQG